jgi:hypothetical protein
MIMMVLMMAVVRAAIVMMMIGRGPWALTVRPRFADSMFGRRTLLLSTESR